jgi:outer membrane immunogenic protein
MNRTSSILQTSFWLLMSSFSLTFAPQADAQSTSRFEVAAGYSYVHSNVPPGTCSCFSMNGGDASFAYHFDPALTGVAEISSVHASNIAGSGVTDLTLTSYLFGPRYSWHNHTKFTPFGQVLLGAAHAADPLPGASSGTFASKVGGGMDYPLTQRFSVRGQINYYLTHFANGVNDRQNNLQLGAGVVFHF